MNAGDEKRLEVADRMRRYDVSGFKESAIAPFLECLGRGYMDWRGILDELADLIDRPKAKREDAGNYWRCRHCGAFSRKDAVTDCCGVIPSRCCGNCGREWER